MNFNALLITRSEMLTLKFEYIHNFLSKNLFLSSSSNPCGRKEEKIHITVLQRLLTYHNDRPTAVLRPAGEIIIQWNLVK